MKKILLPVLMLFAGALHAQKIKPDVSYRLAIHFNPFALAALDYTLLPGAEYRLKPKLAIVLEGGYIFASDYISSEDLDSRASGFIIRPALRFYHGSRNRFYYQPQIFYKQVTNPEFDWLGKECVEDVPTYESLQDFKYRRYVVGVNAIVGRLISPGKNGKFLFDFYFGLGVRFKKSAIVNEPHSCYHGPNITNSENPDDGFFISVPAGAKFIFVIN